MTVKLTGILVALLLLDLVVHMLLLKNVIVHIRIGQVRIQVLVQKLVIILDGVAAHCKG